MERFGHTPRSGFWNGPARRSKVFGMRRTLGPRVPVALVLALTASLVGGIDDADAGTGGSATGPSAVDVDVLFVERTPRIAFDPSDLQYRSGLPAPGAAVVYRAHVKN